MQEGMTALRSPAEREARDRAALLGLTAAAAEAWNRGDGAAYARLFTEDSDYVAFDGTHLRGRDANARHHQRLFDTVLAGTRLVFEGEPEIRFLTPEVAVMHAMGSVVMPWQPGVDARRRSNQTLVAVRAGDAAWRIAAFHNTRYRPRALPTGAVLRLILAFMRLRATFARRRVR